MLDQQGQSSAQDAKLHTHSPLLDMLAAAAAVTTQPPHLLSDLLPLLLGVRHGWVLCV